MKQYITTALIFGALASTLPGCVSDEREPEVTKPPVTLITLDPGHFHAALVQKNLIEGIDSNVYVYAPKGAELDAHLKLVEQFNTRSENPTRWNEVIYTGADFAEKMLHEKKGNVVVLSGNNKLKTKYIYQSLDSGLNVLADKPMAINSGDFDLLVKSFDKAKENDVLLYDIMTERSEITNILQRELAMNKELFGELRDGTEKDPSILFENVHYFFKQVSGKDLIRPAWFFDAKQQGEAIADVGTHVVDLVQWECFPDQALDYKNDVQIISAKTWPTTITAEQFSKVTGLDSFPDFLKEDVKNNKLNTHANGEVNYTLKGKHVRIATKWNFQAKEGGDTHYAMLKGTKAQLVVKQGKEEKFQPTLYIYPDKTAASEFKTAVDNAIKNITSTYPGITTEQTGNGFKVIIPGKYKVGHEAHFSQVMERYLTYLRNKSMPAWEVPCMITKYFITTKAVELAGKK
ncbi:MAG: oxidoreductase [Chitinophagaceae bacterium]|nr:oxidoreductase [Chitinophagaceae bacterium]